MSALLLTIAFVNMSRLSTEYRIKFVRRQPRRLMLTNGSRSFPPSTTPKQQYPLAHFVMLLGSRSQFGLKVQQDGCIVQVRPRGFADIKGIVPGSRIVAVDGSPFHIQSWESLGVHQLVRAACLRPNQNCNREWSGDEVVAAACIASRSSEHV